MSEKLPVLFISHGSPMNAILENSHSKFLENLGKELPVPKAIMVISAHWKTNGTFINIENQPKQIYDFYGFPEELYNIKYNPKGSREYAEMVIKEIGEGTIKATNEWGLDHGTWAVLKHMYPKADIPVFQMSLNALENEEYHYKLGKKLSSLREKGILIIGSGNVVHNLGDMNYEMDSEPFKWAVEFDEFVAEAIRNKKYGELIQYKNQGRIAKLSVPTDEHFLPLLCILGLQEDEDKAEFVYEGIQHGSMSMRSVKIG